MFLDDCVDGRQELVFIGTNIHEQAIAACKKNHLRPQVFAPLLREYHGDVELMSSNIP